MKFSETKIKGAYLLEIQPIRDERGYFSRSFCPDEFKSRGLDFDIVQCNVSYNQKKGTLRGMHYQCAPHEEAKIVSCLQGALYDVILDLRPASETFRQWAAVELSAAWEKSHKMVYIPKGCAHGFQTLTDDTVIYYQMADSYHPESARGVRWNDRAFDIIWPLPVRVMSKKDAGYQDYTL